MESVELEPELVIFLSFVMPEEKFGSRAQAEGNLAAAVLPLAAVGVLIAFGAVVVAALQWHSRREPKSGSMSRAANAC